MCPCCILCLIQPFARLVTKQAMGIAMIALTVVPTSAAVATANNARTQAFRTEAAVAQIAANTQAQVLAARAPLAAQVSKAVRQAPQTAKVPAAATKAVCSARATVTSASTISSPLVRQVGSLLPRC